MQIRFFKPEDYNEAYALWDSTPGMNLGSLNNTYEGIKSVVDHNPQLCFAAIDDDGKIIGTILGGTDGRKGYLYHTAIADGYRGQHIGTQLIRKVLAGFKTQGIEKIGLFTTNDNIDGRKFWEHFGFKQRTDITYLDIDLDLI